MERKFEAISRVYPDAHEMLWADAVSEYALLARTSTLHHFSRWPWTPSTSNDLACYRHVMANMNDARSDRASEVLYKMLEAGLTRDEVKDFISFIEVAIEEVSRDHIDTGRSESHSGMVDGGWVLMELSREGKLTGRRISGGKYHPEDHDFDIWPDGMPWLKLRPDTVGRGDHPSQARPVDSPARAPSVEICRRAGTRPRRRCITISIRERTLDRHGDPRRTASTAVALRPDTE